MHQNKLLLNCHSCPLNRPCCKRVDLTPLPLRYKDLRAFGKQNALYVTVKGEKFYRAKPGDKGNCPHHTPEGCNLDGGKVDNRPLFCRCYPFIGNGTIVGVDIFCPESINILQKYVFCYSPALDLLELVRDFIDDMWELRYFSNKIMEKWQIPLVLQFPDEFDTRKTKWSSLLKL